MLEALQKTRKIIFQDKNAIMIVFMMNYQVENYQKFSNPQVDNGNFECSVYLYIVLIDRKLFFIMLIHTYFACMHCLRLGTKKGQCIMHFYSIANFVAF